MTVDEKMDCIKIGRRFGVLSILFVGVSLAIATFLAWFESVLFGILYTFGLFIGFYFIITCYCVKCVNKKNCMHGILGPIASLFPDKSDQPYSLKDYLMVLISIVFILGFPNLYLWKSLFALITFWILVAIGVILIFTNVCNRCGNSKCALCKKKKLDI